MTSHILNYIMSNRLFLQDIKRLGCTSCHSASGGPVHRTVLVEAQLRRISREHNSSRAATSVIGHGCFDTCTGQRRRAGYHGDVSVKSAHSVKNAFWEVSEGRVFRVRCVKMNEKENRR